MDPASGSLRYANAGHDIPYLAHSGEIVELRATGMPLGLMPDMDYPEQEVTVAAQDAILFYTEIPGKLLAARCAGGGDEMSEHTGESYNAISKKYADKLENDDRAPYNAYYERPAMLSQLPSLAGLRVLDAGCGTGKLAENLTRLGAEVTAFDLNADFVLLARKRLGERAAVLQADLSQPLAFAGDETFDLVTASLVMHYLKDWVPSLREIYRVLAPGGRLVFSTHHPVMVWRLAGLDNYHAETLIEDEWEVGKVRYYHHSLDYISGALRDSGFVIEHLREPQPTEDFKRVDPAGYEKLMKNPWFLVIRASKSERKG